MFCFLFHRPSCLIEAYGSRENYWIVCVGLLAATYSISTLVFLATACQQWQTEQQVLWMYSAILTGPIPVAMDS
jgi:uncharacterized membrane protein YkgB